MNEEKESCYSCKFRGGILGSCHSCCKHPDIKEVSDSPLVNVMGMFASVGRIAPFQAGAKKLNIKGNPHGIKKGWFIWPVNFDPVWLENCDGFTQKEKPKKDGT